MSALDAAGLPPELIAGSKMETFFGDALPARFFRTRAGAVDIVWTTGQPPLVACSAPEGGRVIHAITPLGRPTQEIDAGRPLTVAVYWEALVVTDDDRLVHALSSVLGAPAVEEPCDRPGEMTATFAERTAGVVCGQRPGLKIALSLDPPEAVPGAWRITGCVLASFGLRTARVVLELPDGRSVSRLIATNVPQAELIPFELTVRTPQVLPLRARLAFLDQ